jgi:hypothetical protein
MSKRGRRPRPASTPDFVVRCDALPGEHGLLDLGELVVTFVGGHRERLHFFASRLTYPRLLHIEITPSQRAETVVQELFTSFEA